MSFIKTTGSGKVNVIFLSFAGMNELQLDEGAVGDGLVGVIASRDLAVYTRRL